MTVVSVTDGFSVFDSSFDYLYRDKKLVKLCAYDFFTFYVKVPVPRFDLKLAHPQHAPHCLLRLKQPRVSITNCRAIKIPQY